MHSVKMNTLKYIYRYPVKGFPGETLDQVELKLDEGLPGDRATALSSGAVAVNPPGEWTPCQAFQRMTIRPDMTTFKIEEGRVYTKGSENQDLGSVAEVFGAGTTINQTITKRGYWDHRDSALSIINIGTVEAISKMTGVEIDPRRFRANLYIHAEPWAEFKWIGQEISFLNSDVNDPTVLNIIRPIDRCRATSVDIDSGKRNINMPATLMRYFGSIYCGVYAMVKKPGMIKSDSAFKVSNQFPYQLSKQLMSDAASQKTAAHTSEWPRAAIITKIKTEADGIKSVWIDDALKGVDSLKKYQAGQYLRIHDLSSNHTWRSYTISEAKDNQLRITVKRDLGEGSQAIHELDENDSVIISGPFGDATLNDKSEAMHFISAGIGITPTVTKIQALAKANYQYPVRISHVARRYAELALWDDVKAAAKQLSNVVLTLYLTAEKDLNDSDHATVIQGRPDYSTLAKQSKSNNADVHLCGPESFVAGVSTAMQTAGISEKNIFIDLFTSPAVDVEMRDIPPSDAIEVTLSVTKLTDYWKPEDGTLLDFVDSRGGGASSHCRAGLCKTCQCKIISGSTTRLVGEEGEDTDETLLCTSIPAGPLVLEV